MAKRRREIVRERLPRPRATKPPDCCEFRMLVTACTESSIVAVGSEINVDENLSVNTNVDAISRVDLHLQGDAIAHVNAAAFGPPPPPGAAGSDADSASSDKADGDSNSGSDSNADSRLQTRERKARDVVAKSDRYCLEWKPIGARGPVVVRVEMSGEVQMLLPSAFAEGSAKASTVKVIDTNVPRVHGVTRVRVEGADFEVLHSLPGSGSSGEYCLVSEDQGKRYQAMSWPVTLNQ